MFVSVPLRLPSITNIYLHVPSPPPPPLLPIGTSVSLHLHLPLHYQYVPPSPSTSPSITNMYPHATIHPVSPSPHRWIINQIDFICLAIHDWWVIVTGTVGTVVRDCMQMFGILRFNTQCHDTASNNIF